MPTPYESRQYESDAYNSSVKGHISGAGAMSGLSGLGGLGGPSVFTPGGGGSGGQGNSLGGLGSGLQGAPQQLKQPTESGIDKDIMRPDVCEAMFPMVAWLSNFGMNIYYWSGDQSEWTEYAIRLPKEILPAVVGPNGATLTELQQRSGCRMWLDRERLLNESHDFLVFHRGSTGHRSVQCTNQALELLSGLLRRVLTERQNRLQQRQGQGLQPF